MPPHRKRFQIHLSTAIVLMFVAGALIWANVQPNPVAPNIHLPNGQIQKDWGEIGHAHRHGMLHCNLKPANILFDARGVAHVTGFDPGMQGRRGLDETPISMSTLQYISPEQAVGESEKLTAASDVFSLGVILYELLTGQTSFKGETAASVQSALSRSIPVPPRVKNPLVDHDLEAICLKCLQPLPVDRYVSAEEVSMELTRWLHGEPILTRQGNPITRVLKWAKRGTTLYWVKNLSRNRGVK